MTDENTLPITGFIRITTVLRHFEVSKTDWWKGVKAGDYPRPYKIGGKTRWRAEDIRGLIESIRTNQK